MSRPAIPATVIAALGITQIVGYGTLYYSFSILAPEMARDFGWSLEWIFGILSVALLAGGFLSPFQGAWIDRFGAGRLMTVGSALCALSLLVCAFAPGRPVFVIGLILTELAANFVQYGAAFALLVQVRPQAGQTSITYLTLIAGFSSTLFWPFTTFLHAHLTWQEVYVVFAGLNLFLCMPLHAWLAGGLRRSALARLDEPAPLPVIGKLQADHRRGGFLLMVIGLSLQSVVSSAILVHMVPLLSGIGLGATAALVSALFGPAQVASRFTNMILGRNLPPQTLAILSGGFMALSMLLLLAFAPSTIGAVAFAIIFGFGSGLFSITTGTLPLVLFGSEGYGRMQGRVLSARLVVSAVAPFAFVLTMESIGFAGSLSLVALLSAAAILCYVALGRLAARPGSDAAQMRV